MGAGTASKWASIVPRMRILTRRVGTCALTVAFVVTAVTAMGADDVEPASAATPARFVTGWIPNWSASAVSEGTRGLGSGGANVFAEISPFGFTARSATTIATSGTETNLSAAVATARANQLPVVPSITDGTGKLALAGIRADPTTRTQHVQAITNLVTSRGYDGIDLDYEGFAFSDGRASWTATRPYWAAFIAELGAALHAQGRLLSVTVPPIWDNGNSGYWVYAWPEMLPHIDRLRLMVYDWSVGSPGPVSPLSWQSNVISYVKTVVPADQLSKVQIGVNAYGRSWATITSGTCPTNASLGTAGVQMESAPQLAADVGATPVRDPSGELRFTYDVSYTGNRSGSIPAPTLPAPTSNANSTSPIDARTLRPALRLNASGTTTCTVRRTVYYPDEQTIVQRTNAVIAAGLSGISIWALGYEPVSLWGPLSAIDVPRGPGGPGPTGALDSAVITAGGVTVAGWALDPEFDLPIAVTISVTNPGSGLQMSGPIMARSIRSDLTAYPSRTHGFTAGVSIATQPGARVCLHARGFGAAATVAVELACRTV
jgi:spore germination protein YaaH